MSSFHGCMHKNKDGSNRIKEKKISGVCGLQLSCFGKKQKTFLLKSGPAIKNLIRSSLRGRNLTDVVGKEVERILKDGSRQTTQNYIL